ncbi:MAG: hypothetical protein RR922_00835 [Clostridia bacterium]
MNFELITILVLVLSVGGFIFLMVTDKQSAKKAANKKNPNMPESNEPKKKAKPPELVNLSKFVEFDRILDNMIVQNSDGRYTMIIQCKGINYDLMSEIEQLKVEKGFVDCMELIDYPIQIYVQSRTIELKENLEMYKNKVESLRIKCEDAEREYQVLMQSMEIDSKKIYDAQMKIQQTNNMYQYADDITRYTEKVTFNKRMLQRKFYIIFSFDKSEIPQDEKVKAKKIAEYAYSVLYKKACELIDALNACQVVSKVLTSNELVDLLYVSLNTYDDKIIEIKQAVDSGFYNVYSSTRDSMNQKNEFLRNEYLSEKAEKQKIKRAQDEAKGRLKPEVNEDVERDEKIDKMAVKIIAGADIDLETKDALTKLIVKKHIEKIKAAGVELDTSINQTTKVDSKTGIVTPAIKSNSIF